MTPRQSIVGRIAQLEFLAKFRWRALLFGGLVTIFALLAFFPERYLATSSFTPSDRASLGLSGALGELGAINSVFGNQAQVEVALRVGNSVAVRDQVIEETSLRDRKTEGRVALQRYLHDKVEVRTLRGGIITIEMQDRDADHAREIVTAYQRAIEAELATVSERQTRYKRDVLRQLVEEASVDLARAQQAYDVFRLNNRYADPRDTISAFSGRIPELEAAIRARRLQIAAASEVYTPNNMIIRQYQAELDALRGQLAEAQSVATQGQGVGELVQNSRQLYELERDLEVERSLYNGYVRYLRGTAVEDMTADANLRILELPHVDTERQVWVPAIALSIAVLLLWIAIEAYRLRPPPGSVLRRQEYA